ncbi:ScbA/BarX family gamma-butyrolactone biosynthesis protein [Streptomyces sp. NBC_01549]|uniref:ScbA/BarX family gamma-butyrolactone biosynthesis protein n=1 Tax=Streptomyces sp. NBC_01549 TaxID=2975874 RepID=UPI0022564C03|nr:ScbA/BarX family gamma-butyrolactone biosynthesis protein [Streptomyces sp. NBC_01549]MCX4593250.1 ScbA/BarX family gamma-butyrolactone biosynthesis protein [Streptomyces sp. NBC_01549]
MQIHAALPTLKPELTFLQPIPRHLVHRAAMAEVFVTDALPVGDDRFLVAAQWPRDHSLYHPDRLGFSDPLLVAETLRQASLYLAHRWYGVPLGHRFIGFGLSFEVTDHTALRIGRTLLPVILDAAWHRSEERPRRSEVRLDVALSIEGREFGRGSLRFAAVDERRYQLLRHRGAPSVTAPEEAARPLGERVPAQRVGRLRAKGSVLERSSRGWRMRADLDHAVLFDHPVDHMPLMAQLEGARQLGHMLTAEDRPGNGGAPRVLTGLRADCLAFAELDRPIDLVVREQQPHGAASRLLLDIAQGGTVVTTVAMTWSDRSDQPDGLSHAA